MRQIEGFIAGFTNGKNKNAIPVCQDGITIIEKIINTMRRVCMGDQ
jgi:hypothetical protein